jgi:hypothetical protein
MPRSYHTKPADFRSAKAVTDAFFGDPSKGTSAYQRFQNDQRAALAEDVQGNEYRMPKPVDVRINKEHKKSYKGDPSNLIDTKMKLGTVAVFEGQSADVDLYKAARDAFDALVRAAPVDSGKYRRSFEFVVDDRYVGRSLSRNAVKRTSIIGILNRMDYASTLESPGKARTTGKRWPRPFRRAWPRILKAAKRGSYDARLGFVSSKVAGDPTTVTGKQKYYTMPIIELGQLNTLRGAYTFKFIKRRSQAQRNRARSKRS